MFVSRKRKSGSALSLAVFVCVTLPAFAMIATGYLLVKVVFCFFAWGCRRFLSQSLSCGNTSVTRDNRRESGKWEKLLIGKIKV